MLTFYNDNKNLIAGVSLSDEGNMKFRGDETDTETHAHRKALCAQYDIPYERLVSAQLVHGKDVVIVHDVADQIIAKTDALVTSTKNLYISVTVADCFPVFFYDPAAEIVAVAHAGWRGVVSGIIPRTLETMEEEGSSLENVRITIGPGISQENFDFSYLEMTQEFGRFAQDKYIAQSSTIDKVHINLPLMIQDQIARAGGSQELLVIHDECTYRDEKFFSARRHGGDSFNAMIALIGMRE